MYIIPVSLLQLYNCLQPLMLCLSHKGTANLIHKLTVDHDKNMLQWHDNLRKKIQVFLCVVELCVTVYRMAQNLVEEILMDTDSSNIG